MKILFNVPGAWTHGLDSPERGESRWAQNLARLLGKTEGYSVFAASAGRPNWGNGRPAPGVTLISDRDAKKHGTFDFYFDSSWWEGKQPIAAARKYFHVHWSLEERLRDPNFPKDHYIIYPYYTSTPKFINEHNPNPDRTFFLPTPFCEQLSPPAFNKKEILWPTRGAGETYREVNARNLINALKEVRSDLEGLKINWMFADDLKKRKLVLPKDYRGDNFLSISPYFKIVEAVKRCKISIPVNTPACVPDCSVEGVPSLVWKREGWDFLCDIAEKHALLIPLNPSKEFLKGVVIKLLTDRAAYTNYALDLQHAFRYHTEPEVLKCFEHIVNSVG